MSLIERSMSCRSEFNCLEQSAKCVRFRIPTFELVFLGVLIFNLWHGGSRGISLTRGYLASDIRRPHDRCWQYRPGERQRRVQRHGHQCKARKATWTVFTFNKKQGDGDSRNTPCHD